MDAFSDDIILDIDQDSVFFDLSYYVFHRYYSIFNWYKKNQQLPVDVSVILDNAVFMDKYSKLFEKNMVDIVKSHKVSWKNVYLVKDCPREEIWRHSLFGHYKATREERLDTFNKDIFRFTYGDLLPRMQAKYGFHVIAHPRLEADDVIAIFKTKIRSLSSTTRIFIVTNDNDYIQLAEDATATATCNTSIQNLAGKDILTRVGMPPSLYLQVKCILGDKSDNIPAIQKKIGPKTAEKFARDKETFERFCEKYPDAKQQYELNCKLIDFRLIPDEFKEAMEKRIILKST